jgi:tRNA/tmRNA/rRNA uracil-C5-methylase (TrmA/RlmC/RlmD family)
VEISGLQFHVGPLTYLPGNLSTTAKLNELIESHCKLADGQKKAANFGGKTAAKSTLFEIGCGAGVQSILLAHKFDACVGFDVSREAVADASYNSKVLGVSDKCQFVPGAYAKTFPGHLRDLENEAGTGVVILNPGRAGTDRLLISQIRGCSRIKKVIYISSNPEGDSFQCFRDLCQEVTKETKKNRFSLVPVSRYFRLTFTAAFDLYPHTPICEHVFVFSRY